MATLPGQRQGAIQIKNLLLKAIRKQVKVSKKVASGKTLRSIKGRTEFLFTRTRILIVSDIALKFIISGRRAGAKQPPPEKIIEWIKVRRIQGRDKRGRFIKRSSLAFLIGRAIARRGIKPTPIVEDALEPIQRTLDVLIRKIGREGIKREIVRRAKAV